MSAPHLTAIATAIAIIEKGVLMPDSTSVKIDALKLGYICCEKLKDKQKLGEFELRLSELSINLPKNTDRIRNEVEKYIAIRSVLICGI